MSSKLNVWGTEIHSMTAAVECFLTFKQATDFEIALAVRGDNGFSRCEELASFGGVEVEEFSGTFEIKGANGRDLGGELDWSELEAA